MASHPSISVRQILLLAIGLGGIALTGSAAAGNPVAGILPEHDQVIARMPGEEAEIAPAMLAQLNISLHRAKKQAAASLCQGHWLPDGERVQQLGPLPVTLDDGSTVWIYQAARRPQPLACEQVSRAQFFQEMSRYLPAWVTIRPAGQLTTYRLGNAQFIPPPHLATR